MEIECSNNLKESVPPAPQLPIEGIYGSSRSASEKGYNAQVSCTSKET